MKLAETDLAIVGAGITGLAIAQQMAARGRQVTLLDKGWHPGGRFSSRRLGDGEAVVEQGVFRFELPSAHRWWSGDGLRRLRPVAGGAEAALRESARAFIAVQAGGLSIINPVHVATLRHLPSGAWELLADDDASICRATQVVVTCPAPQTAELIAPMFPDRATELASLSYSSRWTITGSIDRRARVDVTRLVPQFEQIERGTVFAGASRQVLRLQAGDGWSVARQSHSPEEVADEMRKTLESAGAAGLDELRAKHWRYALAEAQERRYTGAIGAGLLIGGDWSEPGGLTQGVERALRAADRLVGELNAGAA